VYTAFHVGFIASNAVRSAVLGASGGAFAAAPLGGETGAVVKQLARCSASFALVSLSALVRVAVGIVNPSWYRASLYAAGALWTAAFAIFVAAYAPVVSTPRVDGKPG
jgi:uncharacterized protein involved in response to NO